MSKKEKMNGKPEVMDELESKIENIDPLDVESRIAMLVEEGKLEFIQKFVERHEEIRFRKTRKGGPSERINIIADPDGNVLRTEHIVKEKRPPVAVDGTDRAKLRHEKTWPIAAEDVEKEVQKLQRKLGENGRLTTEKTKLLVALTLGNEQRNMCVKLERLLCFNGSDMDGVVPPFMELEVEGGENFRYLEELAHLLGYTVEDLNADTKVDIAKRALAEGNPNQRVLA